MCVWGVNDDSLNLIVSYSPVFNLHIDIWVNMEICAKFISLFFLIFALFFNCKFASDLSPFYEQCLTLQIFF